MKTPTMLPLLIAATLAAGCAPRGEALLSIDDAERFAVAFDSADGLPDAGILQREYFDAGSPALHAFDRESIGGASRLAEAIAGQPTRYRTALVTCLSSGATRDAEAEARDLLSAYRRIFPEFRTPPVHLLVGADNSSGMRLSGGAVAIAIERVCAEPAWQPGFRSLLAHEMAHTAQREFTDDDPARRDLLMWALSEGAADYLGRLVRGEDPSGADNAWAMAREEALFAEFHRDRATMLAHWQGPEPDATAIEAGTRWLWNAASPTRPADLGYWIGQRIWHGYVTRATDRDQALRDMLELQDLDALLAASGYTDKDSSIGGQTPMDAPPL